MLLPVYRLSVGYYQLDIIRLTWECVACYLTQLKLLLLKDKYLRRRLEAETVDSKIGPMASETFESNPRYSMMKDSYLFGI